MRLCLSSATSLVVSHACILQNKEELSLPLQLEQIPTAQEFADAIESLSPEQQGFAAAFRQYQLEGNVFAVAVVQIKPHLEAVLGLEPESLTKEIALSEDLVKLFVDYQIPSDLLGCSSDLPSDSRTMSAAEKLALQLSAHHVTTDRASVRARPPRSM